MNIPRGHSSQSGEVEMHSNNWHLDEQRPLYMIHGDEMDEDEMPPHIVYKAGKDPFNFRYFTET